MRGTARQIEKRGKRLYDLSLNRDEERARASPVEWIRLALPAPLVRRFMENRHLCIANVRCLDTASKEQPYRLCLECCAKCLRHTALACSDLPGVPSHRQRPVRLPVTSLRAPRPFHRVLDRRPRDEEPIPTPPSMAIWPLQAAAPQPGCSRPLFFSLYRVTWYVLRTISTFLSPNPGQDPNRQALRPSLPCRRRATRFGTLWICAKTTGARCGMFPRSITSLDAKSGRGRALRFLNHRHTPSQIHKSVERM